jgi:putative intracellular protease/amidase
MRPLTLGVLLFPDFELLDVFGPLEMFGMAPESFRLVMVAAEAGEVASRQGPRVVADTGYDDAGHCDLLLVPGGRGTRVEVGNPVLLDWLRAQGDAAELVASVCTGSGLLARAGLLDGRRATSNKWAFDWAMAQGDQVRWVREARWVEDGRFFTSSGVSAGIDMSLAVIGRLLGNDRARECAASAEYEWNEDSGHDPFATLAANPETGLR